MKKQERKENANKGFSLVELIVVVAIMAVLLVVLTPQYLRYVERTRLQKDNSAISEIANAIKIAAADESINTQISAAGTTGVVFNITGATDNPKTITFTDSTTNALEKELHFTIGDFTTQSNTYSASGTDIVVTVTAVSTAGTVEVSVSGWIEEANSTTTTTKKF